MTSVKFKEVSFDRYDEMLGAVPPACGSSLGFLVGEAENHRRCHVLNLTLPTYLAFVQQDDKALEALEPMTIPEFKALIAKDITIMPLTPTGERILAEMLSELAEIKIELAGANSAMQAVVSTAGGFVDGRPTGSHNILQRIGELVEIELRDKAP